MQTRGIGNTHQPTNAVSRQTEGCCLADQVQRAPGSP